MKNNQQPLIMEITVISAQGLKNSSSAIFSQRIRPFITITALPAQPTNGDDKDGHVYQSRVDDEGGMNPTWGDKFHLPLSSAFFTHHQYSSIYLQIYTKRLIAGKSQLGWCHIPATDVLEGFFPVGSVRHLSYRLRDRNGTRGHGVVNVAVRLLTQVPDSRPNLNDSNLLDTPETKVGQTVIGVPANMLPAMNQYPLSCQTSKF